MVLAMGQAGSQPAPATPAVPRSPDHLETTATSANGKWKAAFRVPAGTVTLTDTVAKKTSTFRTPGPAGRVAVSNAGMIVLYGGYSWRTHLRPGNVVVLNSKGKVLKHLRRLPLGRTYVAFMLDGTMAAVAVQQGGRAEVHLVRPSGETGLKKGKAGNRPAGLIVSPSGKLIACPTYRLPDQFEDVDTGWQTEVMTYGHGKKGWASLTCMGAYLTGDNMAFSPDDEELVVAGPKFVKCFDMTRNRQKWRRYAGNLVTGTIPARTGVAVAVLADGIVTAHQVPTGPGWKYLISVFDRKGKGQQRFLTVLHDGRRVMTNGFLTAEQRRGVTADHLWDVAADGTSIQLKIPPKTKISLKKQAKP